LSRELRRQGRIVVLTQPIQVSPRRGQQAVLIRPALHNWIRTALAASRMLPDRLARLR
jgi:hypothetical protein